MENPVIERGPFSDPVVRCDSCQAVVKLALLKKIGACSHCGNKRVRNVTVFNEEARALMEEWGFHEFLNQFEAVPDEQEDHLCWHRRL